MCAYKQIMDSGINMINVCSNRVIRKCDVSKSPQASNDIFEELFYLTLSTHGNSIVFTH